MRSSTYRTLLAALVLLPTLPATGFAFDDWAGPYVGGGLGYSFENDTIDVSRGGSLSHDLGGIVLGPYVGFNWQEDQIVYGIEGDFEYQFGDDSKTASMPFGSTMLDTSGRWTTSLRARVGFTIDRFLGYATAGVAFSGFDNSYVNMDPSGTVLETVSIDDVEPGWTLGAGAEAKLTERFTIGLEYRYTAFSFHSGGGNVDTDNNTIKTRFGIQF